MQSTSYRDMFCRDILPLQTLLGIRLFQQCWWGLPSWSWSLLLDRRRSCRSSSPTTLRTDRAEGDSLGGDSPQSPPHLRHTHCLRWEPPGGPSSSSSSLRSRSCPSSPTRRSNPTRGRTPLQQVRLVSSLWWLRNFYWSSQLCRWGFRV